LLGSAERRRLFLQPNLDLDKVPCFLSVLSSNVQVISPSNPNFFIFNPKHNRGNIEQIFDITQQLLGITPRVLSVWKVEALRCSSIHKWEKGVPSGDRSQVW
jgi:hypothetical protein